MPINLYALCDKSRRIDDSEFFRILFIATQFVAQPDILVAEKFSDQSSSGELRKT